jgi:hypothetical protein
VEIVNRNGAETLEHLGQPVVNNAGAAANGFDCLNWLYQKVVLIFRLFYLFLLSAHHDWIEPVLRNFDN